MKVWVTGCAGFVGTRLSLALASANHQVVGLSRRACPSVERSVRVDLASDVAGRRLQELAKDVGYPDVVVHAASLQPGPHSLPEYVRSNVLTTAILLEALGEFPPDLIIYISTLNVYGRPAANPVKDDHPVKGNSPYAVTKRWSEELFEMFQNKTRIIILRLPSLYGIGQADSFIDGIARLAMEDKVIEVFGRGETVRDALHVDDAVSAILSCVQLPPQSNFSCINLGCGQRVTTLEYVEALVAALASRSAIIPVEKSSPHQVDLQADITEARRLIGFDPLPLAASMEKYARELQTQP